MGRIKSKAVPSELQIAMDVAQAVKNDGNDYWWQWNMWRETDGTKTYKVAEQDNVEQYVYGQIAVTLLLMPEDRQDYKTMENVMSIIKKTGIRYSHSEMEGETPVRHFHHIGIVRDQKR